MVIIELYRLELYVDGYEVNNQKEKLDKKKKKKRLYFFSF